MQIRCSHAKPREKSWPKTPNMGNLNLTEAELEGLWLTLNTFQMQFLFQTICFSYVWHHYNWHHLMQNWSTVNSLVILRENFFKLSLYCQIRVTFFVKNELFTMSDMRTFAYPLARYPKKETVINHFLPFWVSAPARRQQ